MLINIAKKYSFIKNYVVLYQTKMKLQMYCCLKYKFVSSLVGGKILWIIQEV